ncbi:kinase-like protein [Athelia psychrophila]|uniref:Kinase-like protein n=1 Tax=Athelia psychrophila TaxID=1759441 RepID=A0A166W498_9AGAM|nr:kinase-like protein [Fibularhizoctonia sp. CBS 109695]
MPSDGNGNGYCELQIMYDCHSMHIVSFYGAFLSDPNICICMGFIDKGSLDGICKKIGAIDIDVVAHMAIAVLEGLTYPYDVRRIIHRDIKPSNILCNSKGQIKICDFGVSGELINSIADTFVGTSTYMGPERIQGAPYTVKSDVWSLGISLIELALGRFPFSESDHDDSDLSDFEGNLSPANPAPLPAEAAPTGGGQGGRRGTGTGAHTGQGEQAREGCLLSECGRALVHVSRMC